MIGKPYSGKPNVRFDEGELEIEPFGNYASSLLYCERGFSNCFLRIAEISKTLPLNKEIDFNQK